MGLRFSLGGYPGNYRGNNGYYILACIQVRRVDARTEDRATIMEYISERNIK